MSAYFFSPTRLPAGCLIFLLLCISCNKSRTIQHSKELLNGHQKMLQILEDTRRKIDTPNNNFAAMAKIIQCDSILATTRDPNVQLTTLVKKAIFLLEYGDEVQSVAMLENTAQTLQSSPEGLKVVLPYLGTAYMRLAERNNCVKGHSSESCIMPIKGKGIHKDKAPAQKAVETFERLLKLDPKQYDAIWLLNIAYMTLGEYPSKVPTKWLIAGLNQADYVIKPFVECAAALKVQVNNRAGGSIADDFDNDGFLDLVTSAWDLEDPMHYFHNNGDGTFSDWSERSGLNAIKGGLNIQQTDYNNDGFLDILVLRGAWQGQEGPTGDQPNSLLRNNGDGTFTDVTIDAGILSFNPTQAATWNDFNRDGWVDLFIGNESQSDKSPRKCELYINQGDGTFKNMADAWGINISLFVKGVASGDFDNDGWPDLFISSMSGHKLLLRNKGLVDGKLVLENASQQAGFDKEMYRSFATWFFDYDNDGWLDIFVCNYEFDKALSYYAAKDALEPSSDPAGKAFLYHNNRNGTFTNTTKAMGLKGVAFAMGANFGDINNDGWLDFYLSTGNPSFMSLVSNKLWVNIGGTGFRDATVSSRTGNLQKGHGVSFADFDNDGDQDIHTDLGGAFRGDAYPNAMYLNPGQNQNNWIYLKIIGTKSNRASIGAKITLTFKENGKTRIVYRELNSGGSFGSSPLRREIGIGKASVIDEISITWPTSGITQVYKNIEPNQLLLLKEGADGYTKLPMQKLPFAASNMPMCAPTQ
ncbi:MAG TPA: hypothetical protein DCF33_20885 [Saprospirales bacterium]|nr:hypothetical protein [Saprospirales bacterium]